MDLVNLAHGSLYMMGAYIAWDADRLGPIPSCWAPCWRLPATFLLGVVVEAIVMRRLLRAAIISTRCWRRSGLILFFNEAGTARFWGPAGQRASRCLRSWRAPSEILPGGGPYPALPFSPSSWPAPPSPPWLAWLVARDAARQC